MRTRIQIEDTIQYILCKMLPKVLPRNIRPAYQEYDNAGNVEVTDGNEYLYKEFTPNDDFIYFTPHFNTSDSESEIMPDGKVEMRRGITVKISVYGENCAANALTLMALLRSFPVMNYLHTQNLFIQDIDRQTIELHELANEQWYERQDFNFMLNEVVTVENPMSILPAEDFEVNFHVE